MFQKQKETILPLLKSAQETRNYANYYLIPCKDFLDPTDEFTDFHCERREGKQDYTALLDQLFLADESASVYVQVYGFEEYPNDTWIFADTLIIFSKLSLFKVQQIFNSAKDIFPDDIGEVTDFRETCFTTDETGKQCEAIAYFVIDETGKQCPAADFIDDIDDHSIYYCWWD